MLEVLAVLGVGVGVVLLALAVGGLRQAFLADDAWLESRRPPTKTAD